MIKVIEGLAAMVWVKAMWFNVEGNRRVRSGGGGEKSKMCGEVVCGQSGGCKG